MLTKGGAIGAFLLEEAAECCRVCRRSGGDRMGTGGSRCTGPPDPNRARIDTVIHDSAQQTTLIVYSAAMRRLVPVNVLRPPRT